MKAAFAALTGIILLAGQAVAADDRPLANQRDKISYTLGVASGNNLKSQSIDVDPEIMARGLKDSLSGAKLLLTDQEMQEVMTAFRKEMSDRKLEAAKDLAANELRAMAERNRKEGAAFLAENRKRDGVTALPSGLQYRKLREGTGKTPKPTDTVVVHYRGTLVNGTEFDSSYKRNEPATIAVDSVIQGWQEGLCLMQEGAKWLLFIPPELAYGENGTRSVEPNSTLVFEVELLSVVRTAVSPAPAKGGAKSSKPAGKTSKPADRR